MVRLSPPSLCKILTLSEKPRLIPSIRNVHRIICFEAYFSIEIGRERKLREGQIGGPVYGT